MFLLLNIQLNPIKLLQRMNQAKVQFKNLAEQAREIHSRQQVSETRTKYKNLICRHVCWNAPFGLYIMIIYSTSKKSCKPSLNLSFVSIASLLAVTNISKDIVINKFFGRTKKIFEWVLFSILVFYFAKQQEIQACVRDQMLACQDLLRHSQKCAGLEVGS